MATQLDARKKRDPDEEEENQIGTQNRERSALLDELRKYFLEQVSIHVADQKRAKQVVEKIKQVFEEHMKSSAFVFANIYHQGSSYEGLKVIKPNEFDLLVPLKMGSGGVWEAVEAKVVNGCTAPGYYFINKIKKETATSLDGCLVNGYINPISTFRQMQSLVQGAINQMNRVLSGITITLSTNGPALTLNVAYGDDKLCVDIVPCIELNGIRYVAKKHPNAEKQNSRQTPGQNNFDQLWRRSYTKKEQIILREMDWQNECRRTCLKILKTIRVKKGASQLGMFSSYHLKTCMLHLNDDTSITSWHQDNLHHRFKDLLNKLIKFLEDRNLPNFFNPSENLFQQFSEDSIRNVLRWLREIIRSDQQIIDKLLHGQSDVMPTPDNFQVFVVNQSGKTKPYENMRKKTTVKHLKQEVHEKQGVPVSQQRMTYESRPLEDRKTLGDYNIGQHSNIQLLGRLRGGGGNNSAWNTIGLEHTNWSTTFQTVIERMREKYFKRTTNE